MVDNNRPCMLQRGQLLNMQQSQHAIVQWQESRNDSIDSMTTDAVASNWNNLPALNDSI